VDDPAAHHLGGWDRALCRGRRRLLPTRDRRRSRRRALRPASPTGGGGHRPGNHGHAPSLGGRMGMAELEVPPPSAGRGDHLRPLDTYAEAAARRRGTHRHRRVEGGRPHRRWSHVRGGGGRGQRAAQGSGRPDPTGPTRPTRRRRPGRSGVPEAPRSAVARHGKAGGAGPAPGRGCAYSGCREDEHRQAAPAPAPTCRQLIRPRRPALLAPSGAHRQFPSAVTGAGHRAGFGPANRCAQPR